jgi:hypothetical protein
MDILLRDGDLYLQGGDVALETNHQEIVKGLVRRAILTPLGHLSRPVLEQGECRYVDSQYGDGIYRELGEPFTYDFLSRARKHIERALYYAPEDVSVHDIGISLLSSNEGPMNAVSIRVSYDRGGNSEELIFEVPLP